MDGDQLHEILRGHDVTVAYLFGSRAEGVARQTSDYDIAVLFGHTPTLREVGMLQSALAQVANVPVDVVELDRAQLELQAKVVQDGRLIFSADEPRRVAFETKTRSCWFDFRPVQRQLTRAYLRRVATRGL